MSALTLLREINTPAIQSYRRLDGSKTVAPHVQDAINRHHNASLVHIQKMHQATRRVFNPYTNETTVFKDCNSGRTYIQIGKRLEYFTPETLESMVEPRPAPSVEPLKI